MWDFGLLGIVLKKARMTKKGKVDANVPNGELIETLVILSGDLVQVVTKVCDLWYSCDLLLTLIRPI